MELSAGEATSSLTHLPLENITKSNVQFLSTNSIEIVTKIYKKWSRLLNESSFNSKLLLITFRKS